MTARKITTWKLYQDVTEKSVKITINKGEWHGKN